MAQENDKHHQEKEKLENQKEQKFTDDIPLEDLKINMKQEEKKKKSQDTSQSERAYEE